MKYAIFSLVILPILFFYSPIYGQSTSDLIKVDVTIGLTPENPGPNESVTATIVSYGTDLDKSTISWTVNGSTKKSGRGEKAFSFTSGDMNTTTSLGVSVQTVEGEFIQKSITIRPANVDLVWQSYGYVPPFYKGKALFAHQNKITFIAIPHLVSGSQEIPAKNLIYRWKNNGSIVESASGYGKNTYTIVGSVISRTINVDVEVTSSVTNAVGKAFVSVKPTEPSVVMYKKNPLYGIEFQNALTGTVDLEDLKEITIVGVPFYYGGMNMYLGDLSYRWAINGLPIDQDLSQTTRVFRPKEDTSGTSNISLKIENPEDILQYAGTNFSLKFGNQN